MKSKNKIDFHNIPKRSESDTGRNLDIGRLKRRNLSSSILYQKNSEFLQKHHKVFAKASVNWGDADTYFRQNLRKYDNFDLNFTLSQKSRPLKAVEVKPVKAEKKVASPKKSEEDPELDLEIFYSPSNFSEASSPTLTKRLDEEEDSKTELEMAEEAEEGITDMEAPTTETEGDEGEEENLQEVEKMLEQATDELEKAMDDKDLFEESEDEEGMGMDTAAGGEGGGSFFKSDPKINAEIMMELEDADKKAKETMASIEELKARVTELLKKEKMTEVEAKELEEINIELKEKIKIFSEKTQRIFFLLGQSELFEKMIGAKPPLQRKYDEDILPKVIVCGTQENMPKIILCDDKKRRKKKKPCPLSQDVAIPAKMVPKYAKRLSESYNMQERLANDNAGLEGMRYQLQSDVVNKDQTIDCLQRKLGSIQGEMRMICQENAVLNQKVQDICCSKQPKVMKSPCGKSKCPYGVEEPTPCPATEMQDKLDSYSETTKQLEKQLKEMENEVKTMHDELSAVQNEREHMEQHRKVLCIPPFCMPPCFPLPICAPKPPCMPMPDPCGPSPDQQLRELQERYNRLQDDFKGKVTEVALLRTDNDKLKCTAQQADEAKKKAEERVKELDRNLKYLQGEKNKFAGSKEQLVEQEQQLAVAKQRFRQAQDELDELRACVEEQKGQLDDYRNKYLKAEQEGEEYKRQLEINQMEAERLTEQVNLDIQRVKNQFHEKLQDLAPLPDLLKQTQIKLQEAQKMHLLAERNNEAISNELQMYKDKVAAMNNEINSVRSDQQLGEDEKVSLGAKLEELESKCIELQEENDNMKIEMARIEEMAAENERTANEKMHEIVQLNTQLEEVREESARQVARNKDRCETVRRSMQNEICELERLLAQSRAQAKTAQKDRDEIRQKMQAQINNLHENFEDAQMRIRNLQGHVNFLKDSYSNMPMGDSKMTPSCNCAD